MAPASDARSHEERHVGKLLGLSAALGVALLMIWWFQLESQGFFHVTILAVVGFHVHYLLPLRHRLPFFLALSLAAVGVVFGWQGAWLVAIGLALVGICHLPIA